MIKATYLPPVLTIRRICFNPLLQLCTCAKTRENLQISIA